MPSGWTSAVDAFKNAMLRNSRSRTFAGIAPVRTPDPSQGAVLTPNECYISLSIARMQLRYSGVLWKEFMPVAHSFIELSREGENLVTIPFIAGKSKLSDEGVAQTLVVRNVEILAPTPYIGGTVKLAIGLFASASNDYFDNAIGVLESFSDLLGGKALSESLNIVAPLKEGAEALLGIKDLRPIVGVENGFKPSSANGVGSLRTGYYAVVNIDESQNFGPWLHFEDDQLKAQYKDGVLRPIEEDYVVFRIDATSDLPDYKRFPELNRLKSRVIDAALDNPKLNSKAYREALAAFDSAIWNNPDLVAVHRVQIRDGIRAEVRQAIGGVTSTLTPTLIQRSPATKSPFAKSIAGTAQLGPDWDVAASKARRIKTLA